MPPSPGRVKVSVDYTYGYLYGGGTASIKGKVSDWFAFRGATLVMPMTELLTSAAQVLKYMDTDNAAFNADPIWFYIPLWEAGYGKANVELTNYTSVVLTVQAVLIPVNDSLVGSVPPWGAGMADRIGGHTYSYSLPVNGVYRLGIGIDSGNADTNRISTAACGGALLLKIVPATDPAAGGHLILGCMRGW